MPSYCPNQNTDTGYNNSGMSTVDNVTALSVHTAVGGESVYKALLEFGQTNRVKMSPSNRKGLNPKV